ncbi:MAG: hypothetical protein NTY20_05570 [Candidatus Aenigmarchaeota archaeon]|nr:hypothetical protein [Candidatus Aenigmarchaeota archaeon]
MDKKRKKVPMKEEIKTAQLRPEKKEIGENDRIILQDVEHIIWNPDLLKKLPNGGKAKQGKSSK